jgi:hypothetical protein
MVLNKVIVMAKSASSSKDKSRTLGKRAFAAISAVEGLRMSNEGKRRVDSNASIEQRRAEVLRAYMEPKRSK